MIVIGLTGSIAMGKSTIGSMMKNINIPVHESDHVVHELLKRESVARPAIEASFPLSEYPQIYDKKTKELKRKEFGDLIFQNDDNKEILESILHPLVQKSQNEFIRAETLKGREIVCLDIPLLFETDAQKRVDYTIVVSAPYFIQRERALSRPNMNEEKFNAIIEKQMPDKEKCARADYIIKTGIGHAPALKSLKIALEDMRIKSGHISDPFKDETSKENVTK
ncbi:MAG: dephospho-CoA kinase [Alphaproteobacteria bacterium]